MVASAAYEALVRQVRSCREAGDYPRAESAARAGIAAVERALGPDAVELAVLLNELGIIGKYRGNFTEAEQFYRRALAIREARDETASVHVAVLLHNLAGLAHARGDARTAEPIARRGIAIREALLDADPLGLAADRAAFAAILVDLGHLDEARDLLNDVVQGYERTLGPAHYEVGAALHNLGSLQFRAGLVAAAAQTLGRALVIKTATLGDRNPDLAITLHNLARCVQQLGDDQAAIAYLRRAIGVLAHVVSDTQPTLVSCRHRLAQLLAG